ncbi:MAG: hypothetical protein QW680_05115 [Pyrobaculum sp.]
MGGPRNSSRVSVWCQSLELFQLLGASMRQLLLLLTLVAAVSAAIVVEFPTDFTRVEVAASWRTTRLTSLVQLL